ncbi:uncharacterized protein PSANT_00183 [Moesziomyces antarcticus]|uniref:Uncharacterized protein n=1 Tax=Pseudozyma antarctica TaxID=84753 RepID=A0A5C3FE01_PSEA2|nr:uncharacterized protein PSANT_00183 [Moesziomyces antarcticus]
MASEEVREDQARGSQAVRWEQRVKAGGSKLSEVQLGVMAEKAVEACVLQQLMQCVVMDEEVASEQARKVRVMVRWKPTSSQVGGSAKLAERRSRV